MPEEKIKVRITETDAVIEVVVLSRQAARIEVLIGTGQHSVRCSLLPTRTGMAYSGHAMGRELVYERSRKLVQADVDRVTPQHKDFRRS